MKQIFFLIALSVFVSTFLIQCGPSIDERLEAIDELETKITSSRKVVPDKDTNKMLMDEYVAFVNAHPKHEKSPEFMYKTAMIEGDIFADFQGCIARLQQLQREYPDHDRAENAFFLVGYTYAEHLKDYDAAKSIYSAFLEKYPNSDLAASVKFELENMGKPIEELEIFKTLTSDEK